MLLCIHPPFNVMLKANWLHQSWGVYIFYEKDTAVRELAPPEHTWTSYILWGEHRIALFYLQLASYWDKLWGARDDCNVAIYGPIWSCELRIQFATIQTGVSRHAIRLITTMCTYLLQNLHVFWHEISRLDSTAPEFFSTISPGA